MNDTVLVGDRADFVFVERAVDTYTVGEVAADYVGPGEIEFDTGVFTLPPLMNGASVPAVARIGATTSQSFVFLR